jgi:hypothetical protein
MKLKVIIHEAEEGGYWAEVPAIPGCATQGETFDELGIGTRLMLSTKTLKTTFFKERNVSKKDNIQKISLVSSIRSNSTAITRAFWNTCLHSPSLQSKYHLKILAV